MAAYLSHSPDGERYINTGYADIVGSFSLRYVMMRREEIVDETGHFERNVNKSPGYAKSTECWCFSLVDDGSVVQSTMGRSDNFIG